tara:strand:- start:785 stop:1927 length:1143 start_codon:yes stop_codon:yes gene_type:complete
MSKKHPCDDFTPTDTCNKTCCPEYKQDSDWCKAFNKRTLEQLKETTQVSIDGMWFNIKDAKNTIGQAEQYLTIIYELLCASLDQVMKVSSSSARTKGDFESGSFKIKEYMKEIYTIVGGAQYNGRHLLQDSILAKNIPNLNTYYDYTSIFNEKTWIGAQVVGNIGPTTDIPITVASNPAWTFSDISVGDIVFEYDIPIHTVTTKFGTITNLDSVNNIITIDNSVTIADGTYLIILQIESFIINDIYVYGDSVKRESVHFRLAGPRGACRNVGSVFNDFIYELPKVGVHSLGLTQFTSIGGKDYYNNGLESWTDDEGIIGPDGAADDDVDETVSDFNCAIKTIGVELDKLRSYRYVLCLREKQVRIYKEGQKKCFDHKRKI